VADYAEIKTLVTNNIDASGLRSGWGWISYLTAGTISCNYLEVGGRPISGA
jgi:hypothetical protein